LNTDSPFAPDPAKLQALYNFAYGLSHEINNPLGNISARAQSLLLDERDPQRRRSLATIVQQSFRAHEMIADLMLFARPPALRLESVDLIQLADTVVAELQDTARDQNTELHRTGGPSPLLATIDPIQVAVALKALLQNSLEAVAQGGRVEVNAAQASEDANYVLTVSDTGPGISPDLLPHIFDPFFSGREAGRGLGLGLSKAWRIIDLHHGQIEVHNNSPRGATITISLPATSLPQAACQK
jgi:signal transduction histidine kinase